MPPAIARLPFVDLRPMAALGLTALFVLAAMLHGWRTRGRPHRIYLAGLGILLLSGPARFASGHSAAWQAFARYLVG